MGDDLSVGSDQSSSDAIDFASDAADFLDNVQAGGTRADKPNPFDSMQAVADTLRSQTNVPDVAANVLSNNATSQVTSASEEQSSSLLADGFEDRAKTFSDEQLESEIKNREFQVNERKEQQRRAENTEDNAGNIAFAGGVVASALGLGGSFARGVKSVLAGVGIGAIGEKTIGFVAGNSADVAFDIATQSEVELRALQNEKARRETPPTPTDPDVTEPAPDGQGSDATLPEQIADARNIAKTEREKQTQFENIAANDPAFRDQALQEAENAAARADAAESRANELQTKQDENVNALAAAEEQAAKEAAAAAEKAREEQRREQQDRSEPNGGQVDGADRGVGRGDVPDSF